jgi:hypothetical protein
VPCFADTSVGDNARQISRYEHRSLGALPTPGGEAKGMAGARTIPNVRGLCTDGRIVFG